MAGGNAVHGEECWCYKPEVLLHHRRMVQWLSVIIDAGLGGRWTTMVTGSIHIFWVKLVVEKALEADPSWCSGKPNAAVWLLELAGHVAMVQHRHTEHVWTALLGLPATYSPA